MAESDYLLILFTTAIAVKIMILVVIVLFSMEAYLYSVAMHGY